MRLLRTGLPGASHHLPVTTKNGQTNKPGDSFHSLGLYQFSVFIIFNFPFLMLSVHFSLSLLLYFYDSRLNQSRFIASCQRTFPRSEPIGLTSLFCRCYWLCFRLTDLLNYAFGLSSNFCLSLLAMFQISRSAEYFLWTIPHDSCSFIPLSDSALLQILWWSILLFLFSRFAISG